MAMGTDEPERRIILKSLDPEGEPWFALSYEEGLKEIDDFWPSPELKAASPSVAPAPEDELTGEVQAAKDYDFDGLMEDIDEIAQFAEISQDGDDTLMKDDDEARAENGKDTFTEGAVCLDSLVTSIDNSSPESGAAASVGSPDQDSPVVSGEASPELPTFQHLKASTPSTKTGDGTRDRSSTVVPSSELRSSMQKEMHSEDEAAVAAAKDSVYPYIPPLTGLGRTATASNEDDFKSLVNDIRRYHTSTRPSADIDQEPSASIVRTPQVGIPTASNEDILEGQSAVPSSPSPLHQHGRKRERAPTPSPAKTSLGCDSRQTSPTRPLAKKPRRRGRTTSQSELQVADEAVQDDNDARNEQDTAEHAEEASPQPNTSTNMPEDDSTLTELTLDLDPDGPPKASASDGVSSSLPSGESWNFDALEGASKPVSEEEDAMDVDQDIVDVQQSRQVKEALPLKDSTTKTRRDSFLDTESDVAPDESATSPAAASASTKSRSAIEPMRAQTVSEVAPVRPTRTGTASTQVKIPATGTNASRHNSQPPGLIRKPPNREVAALVGHVGLDGAGGIGQSSIPRMTRGQKQAEEKALESSSPNPSKAAKKRHPAALDYSKMM
jgi:hypothetical protein